MSAANRRRQPHGRRAWTVVWDLYRTPSEWLALSQKAWGIARTHGLPGLVRAVQQKLQFPTKPIAALMIKPRASLAAFERRTHWIGQGLSQQHSVELIVPTKGNQHLINLCLASIQQSTPAEAQLSITVINNGPEITIPASFQFSVQVLVEHTPFNWSQYNNRAAATTDADFLLFLNDDVQAIHDGWLDAMLLEAATPTTGAVGAKLLYEDGRIQHLGISVADNVTHLHRMYPRNAPYTDGTPQRPRSVDAVTGACLLTPRALHNRLGGFEPKFAYSYNDVDYCLRVRQMGLEVRVTPHAELVHLESATRPLRVLPDELALFTTRWPPPLRCGGPQGRALSGEAPRIRDRP